MTKEERSMKKFWGLVVCVMCVIGFMCGPVVYAMGQKPEGTTTEKKIHEMKGETKTQLQEMKKIGEQGAEKAQGMKKDSKAQVQGMKKAGKQDLEKMLQVK